MTGIRESKCLAIIPARGGSKRIPRKNIRQFDGKPIIAYPIESALASNCFDELMVSSDDEEILSIAREFGASTPFKRSSSNSNDTASTASVISEVLKDYVQIGQSFGEVCCIYPTAVFITPSIIKESFLRLSHSGADTCISVLPFSHPIQRALQIDQNIVSFMFPENELARSQDLTTSWHDAGQFYWIKTSAFEKQKKIFMSNSIAFQLSHMSAQDIDSWEDWEIAEFKYQYARKFRLFQ